MSWPVAGNHVDVERHHIASSVCLQEIHVVLVLVAPAGVGVAIVVGVGDLCRLLDGAGQIYQKISYQKWVAS